MNIPYTLVSMAAILRDHDDPNYLNDEHYNLASIADYLYNSADGAFSDHPEDNLLPEFKVLFDKYGKAYFDKVLDDMYALDGQLTSNAKVQELIQDYEDRLGSVTASTKVTASTDSLKYTAFYNEDILDVFDTYDEAVNALKSEIFAAIDDGHLGAVDFEECWVETDDEDAEVMYCADTDPDFAGYVNTSEPLSEAQVKDLWDTTAMYVDFGDSDAMLQDNGYTLSQALEFLRQGYSIYVD